MAQRAFGLPIQSFVGVRQKAFDAICLAFRGCESRIVSALRIVQERYTFDPVRRFSAGNLCCRLYAVVSFDSHVLKFLSRSCGGTGDALKRAPISPVLRKHLMVPKN